jgi:flagellar biosynthesis protein
MVRKEKKKKTVAVKYRPKIDDAPKVIAKGQGKVAEKIIEIAREHQLHIHNDPDLIEVLSQLDINEEIPPDLYIVIAELLAFVYSLNRSKATPNSDSPS